jgi:hypothetical protein
MAGTSRMVLGGKHAVARGTRGEVIGIRGHSCKVLATVLNSVRTFSGYSKLWRFFHKTASAAADARAVPLVLGCLG